MATAVDYIGSIYKSANQVKIQPTMPGYHGQQTRIMGYISNGSQILYTVPADHRFLLLNWSIQIMNSLDTYEKAYANIKDSGVTTRYRFFYSDDNGQGTLWQTQSYTIPLEMEAGDLIIIFSNAASLSIWGSFFGIEFAEGEWQ